MADHAMNTPLVVRAFRFGAPDSVAFEQVRASLPSYRGVPSEAVAPGLECLLALRGSHPVGRVTLGVAAGLHGVAGECGLIGHFESHDPEAARVVLQEARTVLAARGANLVLSPINGSTWGRYRLALAGEEGAAHEPSPFLGEPVNPSAYPPWFEAAGFSVAARYESRVDESPHDPAPDAAELAARVARAGIRVRTLDLTRFDAESRVLHELSLAAFADNLYYTPVAWEDFHAQYEKLRGILRPELVLIAENASGRPVAFQFAYLDPLAAAAGAARAVVKTVATLPEARGMGLAGHMLDLLRERAVALGARSVIHALMHVANFSMQMSSRHRSRVFRRYALYEWRP
jgi:L-amino acid N-acyltransferase YncA